MTGHQRSGFTPVLIKTVLTDNNADSGNDSGSNKLLDIKVDANPMDELVDVRVRVSARPLQIVFDAETLTEMMRILMLSEDSFLPL